MYSCFAAQQLRQGADQLFLAGRGHFRVAVQHDLAAAVRQARGRILEGHRPRQPHAFLGGDVGGHAYTADRRTLGDIVDNQHRLQADRWFMDVYDLGRPECVGE